MKTIILVLCLVATNAFCQSPLTEWALKFYASAHPLNGTSIPPLNRKIIQEADKLIDKKVGKGICREFVFKVLSSSSTAFSLKKPLKMTKKEAEEALDTYWEEITDTIYPGDIIIYNKHIAIIYAELSPLEYRIIHQNFSGKRKYSHVGFGTVNLEEVYLPIIYRINL